MSYHLYLKLFSEIQPQYGQQMSNEFQKDMGKTFTVFNQYLRGSKSTLFEILQNRVPYEKFEKFNFDT